MNQKVSRDVQVVHNGKTYVGTATAERGVLTVECMVDGVRKTKTTQVGGTSVPQLAQMLLSEIVRGV